MHNIEICPNSAIVDWTVYDRLGVRYTHCIVADKVTFLCSRAPLVKANGSLEIDSCHIHRIKGMRLNNGENTFKTQEIHIRPGQINLNEIYNSIGITSDNEA